MRKPMSARTKRRILIIVLVAAALRTLLIVGEVGALRLQPDTLTYTATIGQGPLVTLANQHVLGPTYQQVHMTITDPSLVAHWYAAVNANPIPLIEGSTFSNFFVRCNGMTYDNAYRFVFTWRGRLLETAVSVDGTNCGGLALQITRWGVADPQFYWLNESPPDTGY